MGGFGIVKGSIGQYALFIGAGKSYTSFGCTGMQRSVNLKRITTTAGVRQIFQV